MALYLARQTEESSKNDELAVARYPCPGSHSFCDLITCLGLHVLFLFWDTAPYQLVLLLPALTLPILLSLLLFFLLSHLRSFRGEASWFGKFSLSTLSQSPSPLALFFFLLLQCYSRSRPHDEEQGTMGAFSGPLHGPLPLLYDLSPSLAYILVVQKAGY